MIVLSSLDSLIVGHACWLCWVAGVAQTLVSLAQLQSSQLQSSQLQSSQLQWLIASPQVDDCAMGPDTCWSSKIQECSLLHAGNAPTLLSLAQLQRVAPTWMNTSSDIFNDEEAHKVTPACPVRHAIKHDRDDCNNGFSCFAVIHSQGDLEEAMQYCRACSGTLLPRHWIT